ncbi:Uncharacterised protein r2_g3645 [Pycnogonum litorale]
MLERMMLLVRHVMLWYHEYMSCNSVIIQ